jgi:signal peptidase I
LEYQDHRPVFFVRKGEEFPLSGAALTGLLKAVLAKGASLRFRAKGFSMSPFIKDGDVITVSPLQNTLLRIGDIVAFIHPETGKLIVHRLVKRIDNSYFITGDNILQRDDLIPKKNILGRVTKLERANKRIFLGLGPERHLIALSSRKKLLSLMLSLRRFIPNFIRRSIP